MKRFPRMASCGARTAVIDSREILISADNWRWRPAETHGQRFKCMHACICLKISKRAFTVFGYKLIEYCVEMYSWVS